MRELTAIRLLRKCNFGGIISGAHIIKCCLVILFILLTQAFDYQFTQELKALSSLTERINNCYFQNGDILSKNL